jgi:hypothetical protein
MPPGLALDNLRKARKIKKAERCGGEGGKKKVICNIIPPPCCCYSKLARGKMQS